MARRTDIFSLSYDRFLVFIQLPFLEDSAPTHTYANQKALFTSTGRYNNSLLFCIALLEHSSASLQLLLVRKSWFRRFSV